MNPNNPQEVQLVFSKKKVIAFLILITPFIVTLLFALYYFIAGNNGVSDIKITNISSNSATITWTTEKNSKGDVVFSQDESFPIYSFLFKGGREAAHDDRDITFNTDGSIEYSKEEAKDRITHHVTLRNLEASTKYFFRIKDKFGFVNNSLESFTTYYEQESLNIPDPIYGTVTAKDEKVSDGIVFFKVVPRSGDEVFTSSNWYSSPLNSDGGWSNDISNLVNVMGNYILNIGEDNRDILIYVKSNKGNFEETIIPLVQYKPLDNINIE